MKSDFLILGRPSSLLEAWTKARGHLELVRGYILVIGVLPLIHLLASLDRFLIYIELVFFFL